MVTWAALEGAAFLLRRTAESISVRKHDDGELGIKQVHVKEHR